MECGNIVGNNSTIAVAAVATNLHSAPLKKIIYTGVVACIFMQ